VAWEFRADGQPRAGQVTAAHLARALKNKLVLAVVGGMKDNQTACNFGPADHPIVKTIVWPAGPATSRP
jgi:hypothetical protein